MAGKGGSAPARKGARFEARVVQDQRLQGRIAYRLRQAQGNAVDIVALGSGGAFLIQCRDRANGRVSVTGAERAQMLADAAIAGATPLLAWPADGAIHYRELGAL